MSDEKALLAAIWEHPHEDTPRLMYADWLQENGQPERAEFIRVQIEVAKFDRYDGSPRKAELEKRQESLWKKHGKAWRAGLPSPLKVGMFRRGFPDPPRQNVTGKQFLDFAEARLKAAPLWSFGLGKTTKPEMARIPQSPVLSQTEEFNVWQAIPALTVDAFTQLVSSPKARNLKKLSFDRLQFGALGAVAVSRSANLPNLISLYISNSAVTDEGVQRLCEWQRVGLLRELGLGGNGLGDPSLGAIAGAFFNQSLKLLLIGANHGFTTTGLIRFIESPAAESLEVLNIVGSQAVTPEFAEVLAASPKSQHLRTLTLSGTALGDRGVAAILDSPHLQNLAFLNVHGCLQPGSKITQQLGAAFGGGGFGATFGGFRTRRPD